MNVCAYCDECVPVLTHLGLILGNNISLSLPLSLCWLRAVRYLVLFPLLYTSHILSLITLASGKSAASRFSSGGGWKLPSVFPLVFLLHHRCNISPLLSPLSSLPATFSPSRALSNEHNHAHKSPQEENHILIITLYSFFSCNLSRRISFSAVSELSAQVIRGFEP